MTTCGGCAIDPERRQLLKVAASFAVMGLVPSLARALSVRPGAITYPIPAADSVQIDQDNEVILARWQNVVYAFNLSCPHQNTALRWNGADHRFQCPKHKSQYDADGVYIEGRATRSMDRLAIKRSGSSVLVDPDLLYKEDENAAEWQSAAVPV